MLITYKNYVFNKILKNLSSTCFFKNLFFYCVYIIKILLIYIYIYIYSPTHKLIPLGKEYFYERNHSQTEKNILL